MHLQQSTISHARRDHEEDHETQPKVRLETEEAEGEKKSSHNRFRKTRKFLSIPGGTTSTQKTNLDKSHSKTGSQVRGDMLNLSAAFN